MIFKSHLRILWRQKPNIRTSLNENEPFPTFPVRTIAVGLFEIISSFGHQKTHSRDQEILSLSISFLKISKLDKGKASNWDNSWDHDGEQLVMTNKMVTDDYAEALESPLKSYKTKKNISITSKNSSYFKCFCHFWSKTGECIWYARI